MGLDRAKSDHADAMTLANILRTDAEAHRPLPADTPLAQAIAVLARAHQDAVWKRTQMSNQLRSILRKYFPAGIEAFNLKNKGLASREARTILAAAPTPTAAADLTADDLATLLRQAGRTHNIPAWIRRLHEVLGREQMRQLPKVEQALGRAAAALIQQLDPACRAADDLADAVNEAFTQHPDYNVLISFPGLGDLTGPRVLAEIGDDRTRFRDARALKAYAGAGPITRASGKSHQVIHRRIKNQRLAATGYNWAFAALRNLFNRMLGQLHHCLRTGKTYQEDRAFPPPRVA